MHHAWPLAFAAFPLFQIISLALSEQRNFASYREVAFGINGSYYSVDFSEI